MYIHEKNINAKLNGKTYSKISKELLQFKNNVYLPMREKIEAINFDSDISAFDKAVIILNDYKNSLHRFAKENNIDSRSKFESSFLEEISYYLFQNLPLIKSGVLNIYNKGIYAGLKINDQLSIDIIKKDVDFCIGRKISVSIDNNPPISLIIPAISVEVKTYLDATMFGEIKSSSKTLKSATPNSRAYVLMLYKDLADEHIISARQDSTLDEMFTLQKGKNSPIESIALYDYYNEIKSALEVISAAPNLKSIGRLLYPNN